LEKGVEEEQKEFLALLAGECFFEGEVQSKRSELRLFGAGSASRYFGHIYPRKNKSYNKIAPLKGNIEKTSESGFSGIMLANYSPLEGQGCRFVCRGGLCLI
jgi:hypothetical protein